MDNGLDKRINDGLVYFRGSKTFNCFTVALCILLLTSLRHANRK